MDKPQKGLNRARHLRKHNNTLSYFTRLFYIVAFCLLKRRHILTHPENSCHRVGLLEHTPCAINHKKNNRTLRLWEFQKGGNFLCQNYSHHMGSPPQSLLHFVNLEACTKGPPHWLVCEELLQKSSCQDRSPLISDPLGLNFSSLWLTRHTDIHNNFGLPLKPFPLSVVSSELGHIICRWDLAGNSSLSQHRLVEHYKATQRVLKLGFPPVLSSNGGHIDKNTYQLVYWKTSANKKG